MTGSRDDEQQKRRRHYRSAALFHPLRQAILHLLLDGSEADQDQIANKLDEDQRRLSYHLRVLVRHRALKAKARGPASSAQYRWSPHADWARKMLGKDDE